MKVNPVAIQSYQNLTRPDQSARKADNGSDQTQHDSRVALDPQQTAGSGLAVRGPKGNYAEFLSDTEREALELLFARFRDTGRFGTQSAESASQRTLGQIIDLKV